MKILVIDDDSAIRDALSSVLETYDMSVITVCSAIEGLNLIRSDTFDCVLTDVRMPEMDGLTLQRLLRQQSIAVPLIIMTGHGDVPMAVQAVKDGAFDFMEKPLDDELLAQKIREAYHSQQKRFENHEERREVRRRYETLTPQERIVAKMVSEGYSSAAIAEHLEISPRTVDHHRAKVLAKMQATTLPQLLNFLLKVLGQDEQ